ncbi:MAG: hypothetical protein GF329_02730 [Candidatus Lokiarchaeota archaeon]|nr:hypothetical protein [Candidatus Lokiarchaeota archaeon]
MTSLLEFFDEFNKILKIPDLKPESLILYGPTSKTVLEKFTVNKVIVSTDFNYKTISAFLEENADVILLFYPWPLKKITDDLYKKFKIIRDKKLCIIQIPKEFFSISFGIHERIGSNLGLEKVNLFHHADYSSARIFEPLQDNYSFLHLLELVNERFNMNYINYVCPDKIDTVIQKTLIFTERPPKVDLFLECFRQNIDCVLCSNIDFVSARIAHDYKIYVCDLSFNWLNIILEQLVTHDFKMKIRSFKTIFIPPSQPIKVYTKK